MDYIEALRYLYSLADFERSGRFTDRPDIEPMQRLLHELGDPHLGRATVHIAGSKGKGSVAAMVEAIFRAAGYRTGLYTSPHLHRFPERIQIGGVLPSETADNGAADEDSVPLQGLSPSPPAGRGQGGGVSPVAKPTPSGLGTLTPVTTAEFAEGITEIAPAVERVRAQLPDRALVTFDVLTALGFLLFRKHNVDVQIIEVGLGGLLDSTNVFQTINSPSPQAGRGPGGGVTPVTEPTPSGVGAAPQPPVAEPGGSAPGDAPLVTVITNIGLEHREILGDTVPEIARQKAGIIVPGVPVIMAPQRESAADVIREVAAAKGAPLTEVALACNLRRDQTGTEHQTFRLRTATNGYNIKLPLLGKHQLDNAATAVLAAEALAALSPSPQAGRGPGGGVSSDPEKQSNNQTQDQLSPVAEPTPSGVGAAPLTPADVQKGLETVRWPGRIEVLRRRPLLIVDGAHTADSARRLRDTLAEYFRIDQATLVIGTMGDKDLEGLMMAVEPAARRVIATQAGHPRALPAEQVARIFRDRSIETYVEPKLGAAIDMGQSLSTGSDAVVILGSIALAGEARAHVLGLERDPPI